MTHRFSVTLSFAPKRSSDISIAFDEVCAVVVFNRNSVQVLGFVGQTVV